MTQTEQPIEQSKIDDMNEVIAIFEGWEFVKGDPTLVCPSCDGDRLSSIQYCVCSEKADKFVKDGYRRYHYELTYHSSWEEIHNCWNKVYKWHDDKVNTKIAVNFWMEDFIGQMSHALITGNITAAHRILFNTVEWINKNNEDGTRVDI